jgi:lipopolysaccharide/colanic/teichoic acid biosynthesis glycosyltransferase
LLNLLYIGSNPEALEAFKSRPDDFNVTQLNSGLKAMEYIQNTVPDVIVCEALMPGMNGMEVGKMIKSLPNQTRTPFILFLFEKEDTLIKKAFKEKSIVDDIYVFPFDVRNIITRIRFFKRYYAEIDLGKKPDAAFKEYKIPFIKRTFDIAVSLTALLFLSPLFIIVMIAIRLESKGPVIYKSQRVGTAYKIFGFLKFRSMGLDADARLKDLAHLNQYKVHEAKADDDIQITACPRCAKLPEGEYCSSLLYYKGARICEYWYHTEKKKQAVSTFIKIKNDPRVTKVGNFIRNTSIDELPQLINVLKGDMSIVGNRPLPLYEAELLTSDDWSARFMGPAGITGLWQVELRGKKGVMSEDERKALDNQYANTYSFWGDIKLILRTIPALLQKENV